jgi:hypothetical protein
VLGYLWVVEKYLVRVMSLGCLFECCC